MVLALAISQLVLALVLIGLFLYVGKVQADRLRGDTEITADDLFVIGENCRGLNEMRTVVRDILTETVHLNRTAGTVDGLRRATAYQRFIDDRLGPVECNP
jgi:hypothetical protein